MLFEFLAVVILMVLTAVIHYETLRLASNLLPLLTIPARTRIIVVIGMALIGHMVEITLYAVAYVVMVEQWGLGTIGGQPINPFYEYLYYSLVTYTTLGIGDYYPLGNVRILSGSESLVGLLMITWSASFTYLAMQKFWDLHQSRWRQ
ncbi:MAG: hypothetical protein AMJ68_02905 [Acidithiobacillales bacterium SG8_45]|jgi:hypothetical protein|nr:MAG: hypothetical protein AMJ68_02905 [Acidithiobacillales bacterium SG8_45]